MKYSHRCGRVSHWEVNERKETGILENTGLQQQGNSIKTLFGIPSMWGSNDKFQEEYYRKQLLFNLREIRIKKKLMPKNWRKVQILTSKDNFFSRFKKI